MLNAHNIRSTKRQVINRIKQLVAPRLHDSGYVKQPFSGFGCVRLCTFGTRKDDRYIFPQPITLNVRGLVSFDEADESIEGFTEDGIITDAYGGGLLTRSYDTIALEDLIKIEEATRKLPVEAFR